MLGDQMSADLPDDLYISVAAGVARIVIDRPALGNSLTRPMVAAMADFFEQASNDRAVRVIVIAPAGDKFCTGPDLRVSLAPDAVPLDPPRVLGDVARGTRAFLAAIDRCDPRLREAGYRGAQRHGCGCRRADRVGVRPRHCCPECAPDADLRQAWNAPDAGAAYLLVRLVGLQQAKRICFFGKAVHADEALSLGLVTEVLPDDALADRVSELAAELAEAPTAAIAAAKRLINHAPDVDRATSFWEEAQIQEALVTGSYDAKEGLNSFLERRQPKFVGY